MYCIRSIDAIDMPRRNLGRSSRSLRRSSPQPARFTVAVHQHFGFAKHSDIISSCPRLYMCYTPILSLVTLEPTQFSSTASGNPPGRLEWRRYPLHNRFRLIHHGEGISILVCHHLFCLYSSSKVRSSPGSYIAEARHGRPDLRSILGEVPQRN